MTSGLPTSSPSSSGYFVVLNAFTSRLQVSHISNPNLTTAFENIGRPYPLQGKTSGKARVAGVAMLAFGEKLISCGGQVGSDYEKACYFWQGKDASFMHFAIMTSF